MLLAWLSAACLLAGVEGSQVDGVISLPVSRQHHTGPGLQKRDDGPPSWDITNDFLLWGQFVVNVSIGTPPQELTLVLDSASADTWVLSGQESCSNPPCYGGHFAADASSTYEALESYPGFHIGYVGGTDVYGSYFGDNVAIGGVKLKNMTMALSNDSTSAMGVLGIGFPSGSMARVHEKWEYPTLMDELVLQGKIARRAYSLYMDGIDKETGTMLLGGYDKAKYEGNLVTLPAVEHFNRPVVQWQSASITTASGTVEVIDDPVFPTYANLDSGGSKIWVSPDMFKAVVKATGAVHDDWLGSYTVDCDIGAKNPGSLDFRFGNGSNTVDISVPFSELATSVTNPRTNDWWTGKDGTRICVLGVSPWNFDSSFRYGLLGDTFLRSAYVVYDLDHLAIRMAPIRHNATDSKLVVFGKDDEPEAGVETPSGTGAGGGSDAAGTDESGASSLLQDAKLGTLLCLIVVSVGWAI